MITLKFLLGVFGLTTIFGAQIAMAEIGCAAHGRNFYKNDPMHRVHEEAYTGIRIGQVDQAIMGFRVSAKNVNAASTNLQVVDLTVISPDGKSFESPYPVLDGVSSFSITVPASEVMERTLLMIRCGEGLAESLPPMR